MAAVIKDTRPVTHIWTAFFSLLSAILTALGLKREPKAPVPVYAADPAPATDAPAAVNPAADSAGPRCCAPARADGHDGYLRSLPPTIKQRIRAEAHGASPSVRHLPTAPVPYPADVTDATDPADLADRTDLMEKADRADEADRVGLGDLALAA
ncbi:DUF6344 domain-containing protein [Streptomyces lavendofoliae]|uniref:Uncharacterized protein n=1 Tax=Streptomyces lavendofoliae TaxID=67314 RepID=A0A918M2D6_9ACTN|nr:DUF6344 domain-containing protein [Streptomyces lavendofoliae]GGU27820.1 hypothetical protein GCM10010274_13140 [Streptomyces lavendofoliae]